jgi:predicted ArsR family transcriptional regulator
MSSPAAASKRQKLTTKQEIVYRLLTDKQLSVRQVAETLRISTQGVHDHIGLIRAKGYVIDLAAKDPA